MCQGESRNVSVQGLYFVTKERLAVGAEIAVRLEIPGELTGRPPTPHVYFGRVIHVAKAGGESAAYGIGLKFCCYDAVDSDPIGTWLGPREHRLDESLRRIV